jgi:hypothetical protein
MYKEFITRRLGSMLTFRRNAELKLMDKRSFFSDSKRKEIIVWTWLQKGKDKDQIKEFIIDKFNVSDADAESIYYEAYPDGIDGMEEEILDQLDETLKHVVNMKASMVSDAIDVVAGLAPEVALDQHNLSPVVKNQLKLVIGSLLRRRNLV